MRQIQRWLVAGVVALAMVTLPSAGTAKSGRGDGWEGGTVTTSARADGGDRGGGLFDWLFGLMSAIWGEARSVIVPGDGNSATSSGTYDVELVSGDA